MTFNLLGYIAWYTVTTGESDSKTLDVTRDNLEQWFNELQLNPRFLPKSAKSVDAFRSATSNIPDEYVSDDGQKYRLVITESRSEPDRVARHVMRQGLQDGAGTRRVADLLYYRPRRRNSGRVQGSEDVRTRLHARLSGVDKERVQALVDRCLAQYESSRHQLAPHHIRSMLRNYLSRLGAISIRAAGGGYFIPPDALDEVRRLGDFLTNLGPTCGMLTIAMLNDVEERKVLRDAVDTDVDARARDALEEIETWRAKHPGRPPSKLRARSWTSECERLQSLVLSYGQRYDMTFPVAADSLEDLRRAAERMGGRER